MAVTMLEVVEDAFEEIGVKKAEVNLTGDELQSGIRRCNDLLNSWVNIGYIKKYNPVINGSDVMELDDSEIGAVKYALATRLAPSYQKPITQALAAIASSSFDTMLNSNAYIGEVAYPDSLPLGSGNTCTNYDTEARFFPNNKVDNF